MSSIHPEQKARQQIDAMLVASGWVIQDYKAADFSAGRGIVLGEVALKSSTCDYLLLVDRRPVGVIEAKKKAEPSLPSPRCVCCSFKKPSPEIY